MSIQDLVSKSLDSIRQEMFDRLTAVQEEYYAKGWLPIRLNLNKGVVRGMIELWCWGLWQVYLFLALILKQAFPESATGLWLDLHCRQVNVSRKAATKTLGTIYFTREDGAGNVAILAGRVVRTRPDGTGAVWRFVTTADAVLADGALEVAVAVEAEEYGSGANVTAGQISEIATVIPGVDGVENRAGWIVAEGIDDEQDEPLRVRYFLAWKALSGCTKYAYESWALSVAGVVSAKVLDQHPRGQGTVDVVIQGAAGVPTQGLIDAVSVVVVTNRPINDDTLVKGPTPVVVTVTAQLELIDGDPDVILLAAENRVRALFGGAAMDGVTALGVGADPMRDRLTWAMMVPGVKRIKTWTSPLVDPVVPVDGLAVLQAVNLTYVWAAEE